MPTNDVVMQHKLSATTSRCVSPVEVDEEQPARALADAAHQIGAVVAEAARACPASRAALVQLCFDAASEATRGGDVSTLLRGADCSKEDDEAALLGAALLCDPPLTVKSVQAHLDQWLYPPCCAVLALEAPLALGCSIDASLTLRMRCINMMNQLYFAWYTRVHESGCAVRNNCGASANATASHNARGTLSAVSPLGFVEAFGGIGMTVRALSRDGLVPIGICENNPLCLSLLARDWPQANFYSEIGSAGVRDWCEFSLGVRPALLVRSVARCQARLIRARRN